MKKRVYQVTYDSMEEKGPRYKVRYKDGFHTKKKIALANMAMYSPLLNPRIDVYEKIDEIKPKKGKP